MSEAFYGSIGVYKQCLEHGVTPVYIKIQGYTVAEAFLRGQPLTYEMSVLFLSELYSPIYDFMWKAQFQC